MLNRKNLITTFLIFTMIFTSIFMVDVSNVNAAEKGTANAMIAQAQSYQNKTLGQIKSAMKKQGYDVYRSDYNYDWCAWYISACAKNAGLTNAIPGNTFVDNLALNVSKKSGNKIVCVSKSMYNNAKSKSKYKNYVTYKSPYNPKAGDIVIERSWGHIGIMVDSKYAIFGNDGKVHYSKTKVVKRKPISPTAYVTPNYGNQKQHYIIEYNANGGSGYMSPSTIIYGQPQQLHKNNFTREGFIFDGWYIYRSGINKWAYTNGNESHYYEKGKQPSGYWLETYKEDAKVKGTSNINGEVVILYAKWEQAEPHYFYYDLKGGAEIIDSWDAMYVWEQGYFSITPEIPNRTGYNFEGWHAYRVKDKKYFVEGKGWLSNSEIVSKGYTKKIYNPGTEYLFNNSWVTGCPENSSYCLEAVWEQIGDADLDEPNDSSEEIGYVSESDYYAYYADSDDYDATPYYRYATRQKEYTKSTANNLDGWTLYNTVAKPADSNWSTVKPTSGSYETGYLYSCYGWEHNGDWTFYHDNDYNNAVAWIKKNYTVWNYNQFRYFWKIYPSNKGSYVKVSQTVNYRDNAGRTGTKAISGTKLWYEGVRYRQLEGTTYQYWRWGDWSSWSNWSEQQRATNESVKEQICYYVTER